MSEFLEIRLKGDGIKPGLIRSHEIAEILESFETFVVNETIKRNPSIKREDIIVGVYEIADKSIGLRFKTTIATLVIPAFTQAAVAISDGNFEKLSPKSLDSLQKISSFTKKHNATTELNLVNANKKLAEITKDTIIPKPIKISGLTEISAKILRVGGKLPKAMLELHDGNIIYCGIPENLAKDLGRKLYEVVIFSGLAVWDAETITIEDFTITEFKDAPKEDPLVALRKIRDLVGSTFDEIPNVIEYVNNIRREDEIA